MSSVVSFLNILEFIFLLGGAVITLLSLATGSKRESYAAKLLSYNSGFGLIAAGMLCSVVLSNDLSHRLFDGFGVFMFLVVLGLPRHVQKNNPLKPNSEMAADTQPPTSVP